MMFNSNEDKNSKSIIFPLAVIISIVLLFFLITTIDFSQVLNIFRELKVLLVLLSFLVLAVEIVLKSWRLKIMTNLLAPLSLGNSLIIYFIGRSFGVVTPGQVGDLVRTYSLANKTGLKKSKALALSFFDKALDFFLLLILAMLGLIATLFLINNLRTDLLYFLLIIMVLILLLVIFFTKKDWLKLILRPFFYLLVPKRFHPALKDGFDNFYEIFSIIFKNKKFFLIFIISLFIWPIVIIRTFVLALALGFSIPFIYFLAFIPIIALIEITPVSIMGIGPREYAYILFLSLIGINQEEAFSLSLLTLITNGFPVALIGYFFIVKEQLSLKKINKIE